MRDPLPADLLSAALVVVLDRCGGKLRIDTAEMSGRIIQSSVGFQTDDDGKTWLVIEVSEESN